MISQTDADYIVEHLDRALAVLIQADAPIVAMIPHYESTAAWSVRMARKAVLASVAADVEVSA